jgi:hypothetical protein
MATLQIHAHPDGEAWNDIRTSVALANGVQTEFKCSLNELRKPLSGRPETGNVDHFEAVLSKTSVSGLIFCEEKFHTSKQPARGAGARSHKRVAPRSVRP